MIKGYKVFTFKFTPSMGDVELEAKLDELADDGYILYKVLKLTDTKFKFITIRVKPL